MKIWITSHITIKKENDAFIYVAEDEIKELIGFVSGGRERKRDDDSS
ncbi:MAG TPA: hypothetical protein GX519_02940 [Thermoanaerobacterales bacterium]|nr:hypothetical protein [Thermoanaerobacterales bacterium]